MKKAIRISAIILVTLSLVTACDSDILDVDFNTTITEKIPVTIDQGQETINESAILNLDNRDTNKYLNKIKNVEITKLTYKIVNFSGDPNGSLDVEFYANNISLDISDFNIKNAYSNVTIFEVTDVAKLNEMANLLEKNKSVTVGVKGNYSTAPRKANSSKTLAAGVTTFNVEVTATLKVTANPL